MDRRRERGVGVGRERRREREREIEGNNAVELWRIPLNYSSVY